MKDCIAEGSRPVPAYRESVLDRLPAAAGERGETLTRVGRRGRPAYPGILFRRGQRGYGPSWPRPGGSGRWNQQKKPGRCCSPADRGMLHSGRAQRGWCGGFIGAGGCVGKGICWRHCVISSSWSRSVTM